MRSIIALTVLLAASAQAQVPEKEMPGVIAVGRTPEVTAAGHYVRGAHDVLTLGNTTAAYFAFSDNTLWVLGIGHQHVIAEVPCARMTEVLVKREARGQHVLVIADVVVPGQVHRLHMWIGKGGNVDGLVEKVRGCVAKVAQQ